MIAWELTLFTFRFIVRVDSEFADQAGDVSYVEDPNPESWGTNYNLKNWISTSRGRKYLVGDSAPPEDIAAVLKHRDFAVYQPRIIEGADVLTRRMYSH